MESVFQRAAVLRAILWTLPVAAGGSGAGCASHLGSGNVAAAQPIMTTGRVLQPAELQKLVPGVILGGTAYAEVNSAWLREWYPVYRAELFRLGVVRWDARFDCSRFAGFYTGLAQACFFEGSFHSRSNAVALALGPFWYRRDRDTLGHAIIQAITDRGRIFIDPQTGEELKLSGVELNSAFLQYF